MILYIVGAVTMLIGIVVGYAVRDVSYEREAKRTTNDILQQHSTGVTSIK